ncbi:MAG: hypothetical protein JWN04_6387 [Myxococcaceae bacterium]|nr:hypothetical protein [Myxococcaceae bacterium]
MSDVHAVLRFLRERGVDAISHPGGTLLAHLDRTHTRLQSWGADASLSLAGLCHAAYGTDGFPHLLLPLERRSELAILVGAASEAIVYSYCACDRRYGLPGVLGREDMRDRFTGVCWKPDARLRGQLAELTVANELDLYLHGELTSTNRREIVAYMRACLPLVSAAAAIAVEALPFG